MKTTALAASNLSYSIDGKTILQHINLSHEQGKVLGIIGPNGAGKSSLLKLLSGQIVSTEDHQIHGSVTWQHHCVFDMSLTERARQIAVVNQINDPVFALTLGQIVEMGALVRQSLLYRKTEADRRKVQAALASVGLANKIEQPFHSLSGGEQQRGLIARALLQEARLLVLDEPVNHLDVYYQHEILGLLVKLARKRDIAVVISLHDLNLAHDYCDRLCLLHQGKAVAVGAASHVLQPKLLSEVFSLPCHRFSAEPFVTERVMFAPETKQKVMQ